MAEPTVLYTKERHVANLVLNRPGVINAYNIQMRDELFESLAAAKDDSDVRVLVLSGSGERGFCAGADLTEFGTAPSLAVARRVRWERDVWGLFLSIRKPMIAAVHGFVIGSGVEMACLCDVRIASDDAVFSMPEVALGMVPAAGGTQTLPRVVGV
ncbi:MAG: enoyl-CoA hydratase/isomerase family protein, partial [Chloroflexi bacterium]|nr:enoyl-CoA hydratase/isomerase family protein [Chloroflexota bacterium]